MGKGKRGRKKKGVEAWSGGLLDRCMQNGLQVTEEANDGGKCPYNPGESGREDPEDAKQRVLILPGTTC